MCGFVGTITPRRAGALSHRGPSGSGAVGLTLPWATVSLEMTRLAVVDRRDIDVPFDFRKSCGVVLAYNGEVYNWRSLRAELSDSTPWETDCDAEVIARGWRRWGVGVLDRLNGMFGIAIIDVEEGEIFLARDRAGEKPLYYRRSGGALSFASEIKALPGALVEGPCPELDVLEFDCLETTPFEGVKCLGPGQFIHLTNASDTLDSSARTWWAYPTDVNDDVQWSSAVDEVEALVCDAVTIRAAVDVPLAVQVSGGLDSAIVQAVARAKKLYTVTFPDDDVDNLSVAQLAAAGGEISPVTFGYEDLIRDLPKIAWHLDTPATWTACAQWFMNMKIAKDGAVVLLSGEGADEVFGGYSRYRFLTAYDHAFKDALLGAYGPLGRRALGAPEDVMARMLDRSRGKGFEHARNLVHYFGGDGDTPARMARVDWYTTMQVLLRMGDRMAAAFGLENRSPFLDHRLVELGARLPTRCKITESHSKAVLCEVARRLGVPDVIFDQKTKKGLFVPWSRWTGASGWDRGSFAEKMREAWRGVFFQPSVLDNNK